MAQTAPASAMDRRAYVTNAFRGLHGIIYFLSNNDRFLGQLTPAERDQFTVVGKEIIKTIWSFGIANSLTVPDRTYRDLDFNLYFSDRREDFILNPGEPERTAKMNGDIWFNLNAINNPKANFGLLDAIQIMFHEFGHVLGDKKDQALIDSLAVKIRNHVAGFYKEETVKPGLKVVSLVLPYLSADRRPVDYQMEPILIIDRDGQAMSGKLNVIGMDLSFQDVRVVPFAGQTFTRATLNPNFRIYQNNLLIEWQYSTRKIFIDTLVFNYTDLFANLDKVKSHEPFPALSDENKIYQMVPLDELDKIPRKTNTPITIDLEKIYTQNPQTHTPTAQVEWVEKMKLQEHKNDRLIYTTKIKSAVPVTDPVLFASVGESPPMLAGKVTSLGSDVYKLEFNIPATAPVPFNMQLQGIGFNKVRWDFDEPVRHTLRETGLTGPLSPSQISVWNGQTFQQVQDITDYLVPTDEVKIRFIFKDTRVSIENAKLSWSINENIHDGNGTKVGSRLKSVLEVIGRENIRQFIENDRKIVEITSKKMSQVFPPIAGQKGYTVRDALDRVLILTELTDQNYRSFAIGARMVKSNWRNGFTLKPKPIVAVSCEGLF